MLQDSASPATPRYDTMGEMWEYIRGVVILAGLLLVIWAPLLVLVWILGWL